MDQNTKLMVRPENAAKIYEWLQHRGGVAIWASVDLSDPGATWSTPLLNADGSAVTKPSWKSGNAPARIITEITEAVVIEPKLVKSFHIALRMGAQGFKIKLTDGSSRRVMRELERNKDSWYEFEDQECLIFAPGRRFALADYVERGSKAQPITA